MKRKARLGGEAEPESEVGSRLQFSSPSLTYTNTMYTNTKYTNTMYTNTKYTNTTYINTKYTNTMYTNTTYTNTKYTNTNFTNTKYTNTNYTYTNTSWMVVNCRSSSAIPPRTFLVHAFQSSITPSSM